MDGYGRRLVTEVGRGRKGRRRRLRGRVYRLQWCLHTGRKRRAHTICWTVCWAQGVEELWSPLVELVSGERDINHIVTEINIIVN